MNLGTYRAEVFDRQGVMLWSSTALDDAGSPTEAWDGSYKGKLCGQGVYVWKITAVYRDGTVWNNTDIGDHHGLVEDKWGTVTLIR